MDAIVEQSLNQALSAAVLKLVRPLVRVLLRHGMAYGTMAEILRKAYVEEGYEHLEESGKKANFSNVAALTGLTRKEAKRLTELDLFDDEASSQRYNRATRVVSAWVEDKRFQTPYGDPAILEIDGDEGSFSALVKEFSGDMPTSAMLSVLQSSATIEVNGTDVRLLQKAYIPSSTPLDKINILGSDVSELIDTIGHNLKAAPDNRYFQRKVSNLLLRPDSVPAFRALSDRKSQDLLEEYDSWLSKNEIENPEASDASPSYVAVGIYYTEHPKVENEKP